jgi:hypothetical protein
MPVRLPRSKRRQRRRIIWGVAVCLCALSASLYVGCASTGKNPAAPAGPTISVMVVPASASVREGNTQQFKATVTGTSNTAVKWFVNGVAGGSAAVGTISSSGLYTAPATLPSPDTVTIEAVSSADPSAKGTASVAALNPIPTISTVSPSTVGVGAFAIVVTGSNFVGGAQVLVGGKPVPTKFTSSTQLAASGTARAPGTISVSVLNPDPGSSESGSISLHVTQVPISSACSGMSLGQGASLNGFLPFPASNAWNQDISAAAVDPNSDALVNFIGPTVGIHADFGSGQFQGQSIGIPYVVVNSQQSPVDVSFTAFGSESDPGPMPIPADAPIEGYPNPGNGDRHVLVLDNESCWLFELFGAAPGNGGSWSAGSAAVWDLLSTEQRPWTWTSADAAGLSIFAGLVRYDEVATGQIRHAIRFTLKNSRAAFVPPASHWAANSNAQFAAPMGMRMRLKANFDISGFSAANQVILNALKQYGMIMADNGSSMFISGAPDDRWDNNDLHQLGNVTASDFEVVLMNPIYTASNLPQGVSPNINSFSVSPSVPVSAGTSVTLSWDVLDASYVIISPEIGPVRNDSVSVAPTQTTTYTLSATNAFGRSTATVTVTVQ